MSYARDFPREHPVIFALMTILVIARAESAGIQVGPLAELSLGGYVFFRFMRRVVSRLDELGVRLCEWLTTDRQYQFSAILMAGPVAIASASLYIAAILDENNVVALASFLSMSMCLIAMGIASEAANAWHDRQAAEQLA